MFKNKLFKSALVATAVSASLLLTACSDATIEIAEFAPDATFLTSDVVNLTNQEAFDLMIENPTALHILLEIIDYTLLSEDFEVNTNNTTGLWEEVKENIGNENIADLDEWFVMSGFPNEAYVMRYLTIQDLRIAAARELAEVDEDTIQAIFEQHYGNTDYELEDKYDEIYSNLLDQAAGELSGVEVLRLRAEGELEIFNEVLATNYEEFLESIEAEVTLAVATSEVDDNVIARINGVDIIIDDFFHHLSNQLGMSIAFEQIDNITTADYSVDPAAVYEQIDGLREIFGDEFDEIIAEEGFATVEDLFDFFADLLIDEVIVREHRAPTEEQLQTLYAQIGESAGASHILAGTGVPVGSEPTEEERLEARILAEELIERLQNADDFDETFAELAAEYSTCPSGVQSGGDLGTWERGQMVPEFDHAVFEELAVGEFTLAPVWNSHHNGYHIIYKTSASEIPAFEEVRDDLVSHFINTQLQMGALDEIKMELRLATNPTFENPTLQTRFEFMTNDEGL